MSSWLPRILLLGLMVGAGASLSLRGILTAGVPERQPANIATPWMADCLVGVGPRQRGEMARHLRDGRLDLIPLRARARAFLIFADMPGSWSAQRH